MRREVFAREPLGFRGGIPVFSKANEYTDNYERIAEDHIASLDLNGSNPFIPEDVWIQMEKSTMKLIRKYSEPGDMILDVGVGLGRLLSDFKSLNRYGLDISFSYLEIAKSKGIDVCYALLEDLPYKEDLFDIVVCTDVLEHVFDLNLCCRNILSVLKKAGVLIVRVPNREDLSKYATHRYKYRYAHLRNFDENCLRLLFERIFDCEVIEITAGAYYPSGTLLRLQFPLPKRDSILSRLLCPCNSVRLPAYTALMKKLYHPIEINIVVKKK